MSDPIRSDGLGLNAAPFERGLRRLKGQTACDYLA